jgi:TatD DNase family protein
LQRFNERVAKTSFIGEIGLDFSREGFATKERQLNSFEFVLKCLKGKPKFVTVHSRQAEQAVLDLVSAQYGHAIVFHWYTGTHKVLDLALQQGHFFSINPAMTLSKKGLATIARIPRERMLTESDGPFVTIGSRTVVPADVRVVEQKVAEIWSTDSATVRRTVAENFRRLLGPVRSDLEPRV